MTWFWLLLAGVGQPLAMEAYRWAPWLASDDPELACLLVREVTLAGPVLLTTLLAAVPAGYETKLCNVVRTVAPLAAVVLLVAVVAGPGIEHNAPYRLTYLAQQVLLAASWWCTLHSERRLRHRLAHHARWVGFLLACGGVILNVSLMVFNPALLTGSIEFYDPITETVSQATLLGLHPMTLTLVLGSMAAIPLLLGLDRCGLAATRRIQARTMRLPR